MAKILILIGGHLCTAPRPQKEAEALSDVGHDVTVRGFWFNLELVNRDRLLIQDKKWKFLPILDFQPQNRLNNLQVRLQSRIAKEYYQRCNVFSPNLLGYGVKAMLKAARQAHADLMIVHSEAGLWVGNQLLDEGFGVGVDFEDWFSEDLPLEARATRPIAQLKALEKRLIRECQYCLTTSHAMAEAMAEAYQAPKPTVVYNSFPWAERSQIDGQIRDRKNLKLPSLHWFSQTIGPGRGLELLFQALPHLNVPLEVHLRGDHFRSSSQWLEDLIPNGWQKFVFVHSTVPNSELLSRISEHDIGLALETSEIYNRDLTITNKLFQYLQAGLAIVATSTAGQKEVLAIQPKIGKLLNKNEPLELASVINNIIESRKRLEAAKQASLKVACDGLCWEIEKNKLIHLIESVLAKRQNSG